MDEDLDLLKAVRLCALWAVKKRGPEYMLRHIFRWYSKEFHVPITEVDQIPLENILTDYFEVRYEMMEDEDLDEEEERLRESFAERLEREAREHEAAEDDEEFFQEVKQEALIKNAKVAKRRLDEPAPDEDDMIIPVPVMGERLPQMFQELADKSQHLKNVPSLPPDVKMEFISKAELEEMEDWDILGPPKDDD